MSKTLIEKIIKAHLIDGKVDAGEEIAIFVDRVLMQDATGTIACLQFEALGIPKAKIEFAIVYVDHNTLQTGYENADDHKFLETFSAKYGIYFSKPGNGICHQVNLERFSVPGKILLGSDSHTPTAGGAGMLGIGVGGLDVAVSMGGGPFYFEMPKIVGVELKGRLKPWVTAKDVILELLRRFSVKGGINRIFEFYGSGVKTLSVPERATITNMGAELGATSSIFPSDEITKDFFIRQNRLKEWQPLSADPGATYDETVEIELGGVEPLIACPGSPDNVKNVADVEGIEIYQALIGSCVNSNYRDLMVTAEILKGKKVHPGVSLHVNPGSRQVLQTIIKTGGLYHIISAGARLLECSCDGCVGMGSAPASNSNSLRTFNRNWPGRSGTKDDKVYLASPEVCAVTAIYGVVTDPRNLKNYPKIRWPRRFMIDDSMIIPSSSDPYKVEIVRGPNIKPLPRQSPLEDVVKGVVLIKVGDNISTDAIMPAGAKILPLRSNIPAISEHIFERIDAGFVARAKASGGGFIVGGQNYGQGSSREHAALAPMYLGVKAVLAKTFARIHKANLINFGIIPLEFINVNDYEMLCQGSEIMIEDLRRRLDSEQQIIDVKINGQPAYFKLDLSRRFREILKAGGLLNYTKQARK